ncbi:TonB family protein [Lentisphaera marina]|uniref:TonB family protein n=1 Tax=Lentisphaera marina TaxID=1111041 RepID=UPI002365D80D|nr:TonB family protein [Lentisphaera marina]MDD7984216.1 TonB family protein [Lentisphaera marina]
MSVSVDLSQLSPSPEPPTPTPHSNPIETKAPETPKEEKVERFKPDTQVNDRAEQIKKEAIKNANKAIEAKRLADAKKERERKERAKREADKKAAEKKQKDAAAKKERERKAKAKREADKRAEEKKQKEAADRRARERAAAAKKAAAKANAAKQSKLNTQYKSLLSAGLVQQWDRVYLDSAISTSDRVTVQVTIDRSGRIISKKIIKLAKSAALNRAAKTFLAGLTKLPAFPKGMDSKQITETFTLGRRI